MKRSFELDNEFFTFDGCPSSNNLQSLISEKCLTPQNHALSQLKDLMTLQDAIDLTQTPHNLLQNYPRKDYVGALMNWQFGDQSGSQVGCNSQGDVNPSHLTDKDPVAPQNVLTPDEFVDQGSSYAGSMQSAAQSSNADQSSSNQLPWNAVGKGVKDDLLTRSQSIKFRYHTILRAATAMINSPQDVPVSYLNKGQVYQLTVEDTDPTKMGTGSYQYQTFIRISFDEDQERSDPAAFWQLWKTGRASNEFQDSDEEPKAVAYAGQNKATMQVEKQSHDGFSVTWTRDPGDNIAQCSIPIRFNFLSTDFTLSKGVKGMQVRLCAKTKQLSDLSSQENETCFCNVKLFRDHGAERKLSNDAKIIQKKMEKLKLQLNEPAPPEPINKRKRNSASSKSKMNSKNRSTNDSLSEQSLSGYSYQTKYRNQIQRRFEALQILSHSCLPENPLSFCAAEKNDPELYPTPYLHPSPDEESQNGNQRSSSSRKSSYQSSDSFHGDVRSSSTGTSNIGEAFDDALSTFSMNSEQSAGPAACFYVKLWKNDEPSTEYYRAIYPRGRTFSDLKSSISHKILPEAADITQILYINPAGLKVVVDDEFVREIAEGQSMILRVIDIATENIFNGGKHEVRLEY